MFHATVSAMQFVSVFLPARLNNVFFSRNLQLQNSSTINPPPNIHLREKFDVTAFFGLAIQLFSILHLGTPLRSLGSLGWCAKWDRFAGGPGLAAALPAAGGRLLVRHREGGAPWAARVPPAPRPLRWVAPACRSKPSFGSGLGTKDQFTDSQLFTIDCAMSGSYTTCDCSRPIKRRRRRS